MDPATVALLVVAFSCCAASTTAGRGPFRYPDDDHVIITQYGPMRYRPVTADEMNRPYDDDDDGPGTPAASARGYYRAEVIPLDTKTWKPLRQQSAADGGGVWTGGGGGGSAGTRFDVPLRAGYSVRPAVRRRRRRDRFLLQSYPPPPYPGARSPPAGTRRLG